MRVTYRRDGLLHCRCQANSQPHKRTCQSHLVEDHSQIDWLSSCIRPGHSCEEVGMFIWQISSENETAENFGWECNSENICLEIRIVWDDFYMFGSSFQTHGEATEKSLFAMIKFVLGTTGDKPSR